MPRKSALDRFLSIFTDVRPGEGLSAVLLAANVFFILGFYSVLKVVREALILTEGGAAVKSYAAAGQALLLLAIVPAYGAFASRVNRVKLVCGVTLFFALHLLIFYALGIAGTHVGIVFFLWTGIFSLVVTAQFWAYANDLYTSERGKRLFPVVGIGASLGAVAGAGLTSLGFAEIGPYRLMLIAAAGLLIPVALTLWVNRREGAISRGQAARTEETLSKVGGFRLVLTSRYLFLIAMLMVILNTVNTTGGFVLDTLIQSEAASRIAAGTNDGLSERALIGTMAGGVQTSVNLLGFLMQAFLVSRIFKYIGVRGALFILPLIALGSYTLIALAPVFSIVRGAKILENGTDYSIQTTTRHALYLPTSREAKYKAKQAIESFFWRAGDLLQAVVVFVGVQLAFGVRAFATVNIVLVLLWLVLVAAIAKEHRKLSEADASERAA